eukprot:CAMPEP_0184744822 /NCGR_PEP_ID=MMETSP0315-20130426/7551_1 /TAXON_ID=101924 /ORGANISM="Rhodosorus marinus, Strain UTEX LB 2760" /LENGTH=36 /DNA_ID= /DNA_START= /DNA_END= /DNA_ORIENTATION=
MHPNPLQHTTRTPSLSLYIPKPSRALTPAAVTDQFN